MFGFSFEKSGTSRSCRTESDISRTTEHARDSQLISSGRQLQARERPEPECLECLARSGRHVEPNRAMVASPNGPSGINCDHGHAELVSRSRYGPLEGAGGILNGHQHRRESAAAPEHGCLHRHAESRIRNGPGQGILQLRRCPCDAAPLRGPGPCRTGPGIPAARGPSRPAGSRARRSCGTCRPGGGWWGSTPACSSCCSPRRSDRTPPRTDSC